MVSGLRKILLASAALAAASCASYTPMSWTAADLFGGPPEAQAYSDFLAARYAGMVGDSKEAANYYRRAFDRAPEDSGVLESAAFATLIAGDAPGAIALARGADSMVSAGSSSAQLALVVGDIADGRGVRGLARLRASNLGVINQDVAGLLSAWLTATTDVDGAIKSLGQPQNRRFPGGEPFYLKALILAAAGRDADALEAFEDGARFPVGSGPMLAAAHARLLASRGDADGAKQILTDSIARQGTSTEAELLMAEIDSGQPVKPLRLSEKQGAAWAIYLASAGGLARSSPELMTMRLSLALHVDPDFAQGRLALSEALEDQKRSDDAIAVLARVGRDSPWYGTARLRTAWLQRGLGMDAAAEAAAQDAINASRRRDILLGAGDLYRLLQKWPEAEALYDEVVRADAAQGREDWRALFARATSRERSGRWADAEADVKKALELEPKRAELLNFLGYGWVDRGVHVAEGMKLIREAVAARPDAGYIIDSLGWAHYRLGEYDEAVEQLERAVELEPGEAEIVDHLGDAYWRAGRRVEAQFEWRDALRLKPNAELSARIQDKLDHGLAAEPGRALAEAPAQASQGRP